MKIKKVLTFIFPFALSFILVFGFLALFAVSVNAQIGNVPALTNPLGGNITTISALVQKLTNSIVLPLGGMVAFVFFIYAGFLLVVAQGNPQKLEKAKAVFLYTVIGTAILFGAGLLSNLIIDTLNTLK